MAPTKSTFDPRAMATAPTPRVALKAKSLGDWEKGGILPPRVGKTTLAIDPSGNLVEIPFPKETSPTPPNTPTVLRRPILEKSNAQQNKAFLNWKKGGAKKKSVKT